MKNILNISLILTTFLLILVGCSNNEIEYQSTEKIVGKFYLEKYTHGKFIDYYLTDSINSKYFVGKINPENGEIMRYDVSNGKVVVKVFQKNSDKDSEILIAMDTYNMSKN